MRVHVDDDRCRGHGVCLAVCPDVFTLTDDGFAQPHTADVAEELGDVVAAAAAGCPEHAITLN
jgi:ferredoxin